MHLEKLNNLSFSTWFAFGTFVTGTILFILYLIFQNDGILFLGVYYTAFIILLNLIVLIFNIYELITLQNERKQTIIKIIIQLTNIPIALFYFYIIANLMFHPKG